jgi:hypothetical protein
MNRLPLFASVLAAATAMAGPYDQVYSILTADTARSADPHLRPVFVNRVDGETQLSDNKAVVAPGKRKVTVDLPPRKGFKQPTQHTFELDVKPCTRYFLAARLDSQVTQGWTPVVRSSEPIGECEAKFKLAGAK